MDNDFFGTDNTPENNQPVNNDRSENEVVENNEENTLPVNEDVASETEDTQSESAPTETAPSGEYHYNREQYNQQTGPQNTGWQTQNQPSYSWQNQGNNYNSQPQYNQSQYGQPQYNQPYGNGYQPDPEFSGMPPKKKNSGMKVFVALIAVIVVLSVLLIVAIFRNDNNSKTPLPQPDNGIVSDETTTEKLNTDNVDNVQSSTGSNYAGEAAEVAEIAKKYNVGILVYQKNSIYTEGSGVVIKEDNDGKYTYIVTCAHVVNHSNVSLSVLMEDGTEYPADLVGMDTRTDLAVVRIEASGLDKAEIASSENLIVGQYVYAVGNPGGSEFFGSVTNGIISAIARPVSSSTGYEMECIQHTSAINPGNSGGALVNGEGKLIGINSMKIASTEYEGMGFAVPSDVVVKVFNSIIENGYVAGRAKLGISYATPSNYSQSYAMYVQMKGLPSGTIVIAEIGKDSDLVNKDVKVGDMIIAVNGKEMTNPGMLADMIEDMSAGDSLTLTIVRVNSDNWSQTQQNVQVTLVEDRGTVASSSENNNNNSQQNPFSGNEDYQDWFEYYKDYFGY